MYTGATDHFAGAAKTADNAVAVDTWYHLVLQVAFDGTTTSVNLYKDLGSVITYTKAGVYLEDKTSYANAWLLGSSAESSTAISPALGFHGFMYTFKLFNLALDGTGRSAEVETSCSTGCGS
jgi:hypothetical protein